MRNISQDHACLLYVTSKPDDIQVPIANMPLLNTILISHDADRSCVNYIIQK
jgi:hypothetical protein